MVAGDVVQAPNDKQQIEPMLAALGGLPEALGYTGDIAGGYGRDFSEGNVKACAAEGIDPLIAQGRQMHYPPLKERSAADSLLAPDKPTPVQAMGHRLKTTAWKAASRAAQADTRTGVRHHQIGDGLPAILDARPGESAWRMETRDHVLEHKENVRPRWRGLREHCPLRAQIDMLKAWWSKPGGVRKKSIKLRWIKLKPAP